VGSEDCCGSAAGARVRCEANGAAGETAQEASLLVAPAGAKVVGDFTNY